MKQENLEAKDLLERFYQGLCTEEERQLLDHWFNQEAKATASMHLEPDYDQVRDRIWAKLPAAKRPVRLWPRIAVAAAAVVAVVSGVWFSNYHKVEIRKQVREDVVTNDIAPGNNSATLTLADGKTINLSAAKTGVVIGADLKYNDGTNIRAARTASALMTLRTPRGGTYQITLSDGTKVWLNATSSLTYNAVINEHGGVRRVKLSGEAYFEVAKDKKHPFVVESKGQEVEVLGTHFNINNGYSDEERIETTLLEGSVRISDSQKNNQLNSSVILKPGQMAINDPLEKGITVANVNTANVIAWKNGYFIFNNENIKDIMKDLSRWYDFDVEYQGDMSEVQFHGNYLRSRNYLKLLKAIELTNKVEFKIEGRRITVIAR